MCEVLENIITMMHNAPGKRLEFASIDGIIHLLPLQKLKELEKDIKRTLSKGASFQGGQTYKRSGWTCLSS